MHCSQPDLMIDDLQALPKQLAAPILAAWDAEEDLLDVLATARTHPDRTVIITAIRRPAVPLPRSVRRLRPARIRATGQHNRDLVAGNPLLDTDWDHQRRVRRD
jgi:hypothetical protein